MDKKERIKELVKQLNKYSYEYYTLGNSSISDDTYDKLYDELISLEKDTNLILSNSPTQNVGNEILSELIKTKHEYPMLSLNKVKEKDIKDLVKFNKKSKTIAMLKLDGLTVALTYDDGILVKGETRGNGIEGEDITHNIKHFSNIPLKIPYKGHLVVIGEAIIDYDNFNRINSCLEDKNKYKNPRNLVSGTIRQLDSNICKMRKPKFISYICHGNKNLESKLQQLVFLNSLGFEVVKYFNIVESTENSLKHTIDGLKEISEELKYPIDGIVFMYNDIKYGESLGNTSHHPLHSIAYKFTEDVELSTLNEVIWQIGRTGQLTPVALFNTVELCGTTVRKASLHNISIIKGLQLGIGDEIAVIKANEIIPQIQDNLTKSNTLEIPKICPNCGSPTKISISKDNKEVLMCTNTKCSLIQELDHYASRDAMNIVGLSKETIRKFVELGYLNCIEDIYNLNEYRNEITKLKGFGVKSFNKLINNIEKSKNTTLDRFIYALGIPNVGKSTAKDMVEFVNEYPPFNDNQTNTDVIPLIHSNLWKNMNDCGEVTANNIFNYFKDENNLKQYNNLKNILNIDDGSIKEIKTYVKDNPLKDKHIYPTGKFKLTKSELKIKLNELGAIVESGYKKSLDYLICGGDTSKSGKVDKAKKDGIKLMTEEELMNILNGFN